MIDRETLKKARKRANMTQAELADQLEVHVKTIQNWETNGVPWKSEAEVRRVLGGSLGDVLESSRMSREALLVDALNKIELDRGSKRRRLPDRELRAYTDSALLSELTRRSRLREMAMEPPPDYYDDETPEEGDWDD